MDKVPKFKVLLVKTSSLGDVLHNLPVVDDILRHRENAVIDWVVEEGFSALPALHPSVRQVIPVAIRRWRKAWWHSRHEIRAVLAQLQATTYDLVLDTQGLIKSALIARCAESRQICGLDYHSAREGLASRFYTRRFAIPRARHAVDRNRCLAAAALGYELDKEVSFGIRAPLRKPEWLPDQPFVSLLHATSRDDKLWPEPHWIALGKELHTAGLRCVLPWGNTTEQTRALRLAASIPDSIVPEKLSLNEVASLLAQSRAAIGVDTGLSHFSAALGTPTIGIYVATDPTLTGVYTGSQAPVLNLGGLQQLPSVDAVLHGLASITTR